MLTTEQKDEVVMFGLYSSTRNSDDKLVFSLTSLWNCSGEVKLSEADFPYAVHVMAKLLDAMDIEYKLDYRFPELTEIKRYWILVTGYYQKDKIIHSYDTHAVVAKHLLDTEKYPMRLENLIAILKWTISTWELPFEVSW